MYRKTWRYHRDAALLWLFFFLMLAAAAYAFQHPLYWALVVLLWLIREPARRAFLVAHPFRQLSWISEANLDLREVTFQSRDGLTLFGRFVRSKNHATILLIHPSGSAVNKMLFVEFLSKAGYGVFMIDVRAHGSSDGDTSTNGLFEADDVAGAVDYLLHRLDVNGQKIGVLGISLGAQAALRGALKTDCFRALVLEGLSPATLQDHAGEPKSLLYWLRYPSNWIYYHVYEFMSGTKNTGVIESLDKLPSHAILFIASGKQDIHFNRLFFQAAKEPKELWEVPEGERGTAILQEANAYMAHVLDFFDQALL